MPKSRNRKGHKHAIHMRRHRKQQDDILLQRQLRKYAERQQQSHVERYNLEESLENLKKLELKGGREERLNEISEMVNSIEHDYTRGFFTARLDLLEEGTITSEEFVEALDKTISTMFEKEQEGENNSDTPEPVMIDNPPTPNEEEE